MGASTTKEFGTVEKTEAKANDINDIYTTIHNSLINFQNESGYDTANPTQDVVCARYQIFKDRFKKWKVEDLNVIAGSKLGLITENEAKRNTTGKTCQVLFDYVDKRSKFSADVLSKLLANKDQCVLPTSKISGWRESFHNRETIPVSKFSANDNGVGYDEIFTTYQRLVNKTKEIRTRQKKNPKNKDIIPLNYDDISKSDEAFNLLLSEQKLYISFLTKIKEKLSQQYYLKNSELNNLIDTYEEVNKRMILFCSNFLNYIYPIYKYEANGTVSLNKFEPGVSSAFWERIKIKVGF
jgi:hypothetical protein